MTMRESEFRQIVTSALRMSISRDKTTVGGDREEEEGNMINRILSDLKRRGVTFIPVEKGFSVYGE